MQTVLSRSCKYKCLVQIEELESELAAVDAAKVDWESRLEEESQSQGRDFNLQEDQLKEYHRLKEEAGTRAAALSQEMNTIQREQKADQDRLDNESRRKNEVVARLKQKEHEVDENRRRVDKLTDYIA